jgi:surface protein
MSSMFEACTSLTTVPLFNTSNVTSMNQMFSSCNNLTEVPLFNTSKVTNMGSMFANCFNLTTVPLFNTENVTTMASMFQNCYSLREVPLFNTTKVTSINLFLSNCFSLKTVPEFDLAAVTNSTSMFNTCFSLSKVPALNANAATVLTTMFTNCYSLASNGIYNIKYTVDFTNNKLSKEALETIFANLGTATVGATRTITITGNWGAPTPVNLTGTLTSGSVTISMASTTGLVTGMQVTGTNTSLTAGRTVTFTDAGDTVNLTGHGLSNGDEVSFSTITSTTGIVINTIYYVVGVTPSTPNTFQVAASLGGSALPLTTNGSGTVKYNSTIESIVPNTSVTMSRPMAGGSAQTLSFRLLGTYKAILKGFAVAG